MVAKSEQTPERAQHDGVDAFERRAPTVDTLPPTPLAALLASGGASLVVLSTDADLIATLEVLVPADRAGHHGRVEVPLLYSTVHVSPPYSNFYRSPAPPFATAAVS